MGFNLRRNNIDQELISPISQIKISPPLMQDMILKFQGLRFKPKSENLYTPSPHDIPYNTTFLSINYMQLD